MKFDITSPANDQIKWLARLRQRRHRDAEGVFSVEGERLVRRALDAGLAPIVVFGDGTVDVGMETVGVEPTVLDKASYRSRSEGLIAVFPQFETDIDLLEPSSRPMILVAEDIEKPGNLGAMMRTAAAAGADGLITVGSTVDPFNPNAIRSSTGALFTLPLAVSSWGETTSWLEDRGIEVTAASPEGDLPLWEADLSGPLAVVIGAEDSGLSKRAVSVAGQVVVIPQSGAGVDSLNASVAAAVLLFEAVRQRTWGERDSGFGEDRP